MSYGAIIGPRIFNRELYSPIEGPYIQVKNVLEKLKFIYYGALHLKHSSPGSFLQIPACRQAGYAALPLGKESFYKLLNGIKACAREPNVFISCLKGLRDPSLKLRMTGLFSALGGEEVAVRAANRHLFSPSSHEGVIPNEVRDPQGFVMHLL